MNYDKEVPLGLSTPSVNSQIRVAMPGVMRTAECCPSAYSAYGPLRIRSTHDGARYPET